jgi:hypothetical protein
MRKRLERGERVVRERFGVDPPSLMIHPTGANAPKRRQR